MSLKKELNQRRRAIEKLKKHCLLHDTNDQLAADTIQ